MSSPVSLVIQLRPSDRNRIIKGKFGSVDPNGKKFLLVYVHAGDDGYRLARTLEKRKYTYKQALDFVMEGDRSCYLEHTAYADPDHIYSKNLQKEECEWESNIPDATDDPYPFDFGSTLIITRTDNEDEEVTVLAYNSEEKDYELPD